MATKPFSFELVGLKETMDALEKLPTLSMKKTVVRNALKKSALPIKEAAQANAQRLPFDSEKIADSMKVSTSL